MLKESLILVVFFILGVSFVISMNISGYYSNKLKALLKKKYPNLKNKLTPSLLDVMLPLNYIIKSHKYIWFNRSYSEETLYFIKKIRFFQKLGILLFILTVVSPFFVEIIY